MREVLFVTTKTYPDSLYSRAQQGYALHTAVVPNLRMAASILQDQAGAPPEVVVLGHDLSPPNQVIAFVRRAMSAPALRDIVWIVVLDQNIAFLGEELAGQARVMVFQETQPGHLADAIGAQATKTDRTVVISAVNIKGGTGKTSLTINLADALAEQDLKTIVVDADVADGDVAEALGVPSSAPTIDKLARELAQSSRDPHQLLAQYIYERSPNLHVLPAPGRSDYGQDYLSEVTAKAILDALTTHHYDVVLVDLPGNIRGTPFTATLAGWSTCRFLLLYPTGYTFGIKGFNGGFQILTSLNAQGRSQIVVVENGDEPWSKSELEREYGLPVAATLPFDPLVEKSQAVGKTVRELEPGRRGVIRLSRLVEKLGGTSRYNDMVNYLAARVMDSDFARGEVAV